METCHKQDPISALDSEKGCNNSFLFLLENKRNFWMYVHEKLGNIHYLEVFSFYHRWQKKPTRELNVLNAMSPFLLIIFRRMLMESTEDFEENQDIYTPDGSSSKLLPGE